ncbi:hypothetical protein AB0G73_24485 [Streptomyces sp. NPDC020719]|uniref:hypothetical protein n=1 Tax=unclassified Streptomyces TaxID=2593676 RepID=UPI0033EACA7B
MTALPPLARARATCVKSPRRSRKRRVWKALLVVDPRHGTWALHTRPENGRYRDTLPGKYGEGLTQG